MNTLAKLFILALVSCTLTHCYGQDNANRVKVAENIFKDAVIVVKPTETPYRMGRPMPVSITITNIGKTDMRLVGTLPEEDDYRVSVSSANGTPVRSPATVADGMSMMNGTKSRSILTVNPGQSVSKTLDLAQLTHIEREGTYYLTIARRILTWKSGFVVSDKIRIDVVK